jgi:hypothetical protein
VNDDLKAMREESVVAYHNLQFGHSNCNIEEINKHAIDG